MKKIKNFLKDLNEKTRHSPLFQFILWLLVGLFPVLQWFSILKNHGFWGFPGIFYVLPLAYLAFTAIGISSVYSWTLSIERTDAIQEAWERHNKRTKEMTDVLIEYADALGKQEKDPDTIKKEFCEKVGLLTKPS